MCTRWQSSAKSASDQCIKTRYRVAFGSYFRYNCSLEEHVQRQRANGIAELAMKADGCIESGIFLIVVIDLLILLRALNP